MIDRRVKGQSQLDYLWVTYGGLTVTNSKITEDLDTTLPTYKLVKELINATSGSGVSGLLLDKSNLLHIVDPDGIDIGDPVDLSIFATEGKSVTGFGSLVITQSEIDKGCKFPIGTICNYIQVGDTRYYASANNSSDSIESYIEDNIVKSKVKLDNSGNIQFSTSANGLKANLPIKNTGEPIEIEYLDSDPTDFKENTIYFIKNKPYCFFGNTKISGDTLSWTEK